MEHTAQNMALGPEGVDVVSTRTIVAPTFDASWPNLLKTLGQEILRFIDPIKEKAPMFSMNRNLVS